MPILATFGLLAARLKRLPFYYWMSFPIPEGQIALSSERGLSAGLAKFLFPWVSGRIGRFLLYRVVLRLSDHIFVQSDRMKQNMIERGIQEQKLTPVPMGVDLEEIQSKEILPSNDSRLNGRRVLVYLGTLDRPRRIEVLFEMLAEIRLKIPQALLVLVGDTQDDDHRHWLKIQAEVAGVSNHVLWTGWLPIREGWSYVRAAEVGLSPIPRGSLLDVGSPTKVPEYLALGIPVVCNDNPDQESLIQCCDAGICVPYTSLAFASAALTILNTSQKVRTQKNTSTQSYLIGSRSYEHISSQLASAYFGMSAFGAK
jgi:glycosyltransferase involved in cell wall biosynthesis